MEIYADYAATSPVNPKALNAYVETIKHYWGNPSSNHSEGWKAHRLLEEARDRIAQVLGVPSSTIFFTSGGTEGNNQVMLSFDSHWKNTNAIVSEIEHPSIIEPSKQTCNISYLPVNSKGYICLEVLEKWLSDDKYNIVSIMHTNNEIGTRQNVDEISRICRSHNVPLHMDCVQAIGHTRVDLSKIDIATASGHKFGAPKGIGFVYSTHPLKSLLNGGGQEKRRRSGTENVAGAVSMAVALEEACKDIEEKEQDRMELSRLLVQGLLSVGGHINGDAESANGIINVRFDGVDGNEMAFALTCRGVHVSVGSACSTNHSEYRVLHAIGLTDKEARESIRISIGDNFTAFEVAKLLKTLQVCLEKRR